jgi:hypothetical protein
LRLNLDGTIPSDNPFFNQVGKRGEIFAYGFRNPFRFNFDPMGGSLWLGDVGDLTVEEIDIVSASAGGRRTVPRRAADAARDANATSVVMAHRTSSRRRSRFRSIGGEGAKGPQTTLAAEYCPVHSSRHG